MKLSKSLELITKYNAPSSWWEHVPIAHWLIENLKPEKVVELGTDYGVSFFSFCEAAEQFSPQTFVYAVDTWEGDRQAGLYGNEVYEQVNDYQQRCHKIRSRLIKSNFDDAAKHFEQNSIDIIHIDGLHTYEAVKHDFENWERLLKNDGTLIFHDCNVREGDFGVWKLWSEIKKKNNYCCLEIKNGHGLGIATKNSKRPEWHNELTECMGLLKTKGCALAELERTRQQLVHEKSNTLNNELEIKEMKEHIKQMNKHIIEQEKIIEYLRQDIIKKIVGKVKKICLTIKLAGRFRNN